MTLISSFPRWTKFSKTVKYPGGSSLVITDNYGNAVDDIDRDVSEIVDRFVFWIFMRIETKQFSPIVTRTCCLWLDLVL